VGSDLRILVAAVAMVGVLLLAIIVIV
jgi:hypothetical protein